jgi:hypothetical protein
MKRSGNSELAARINHAHTLLSRQKAHSAILEELMESYGVSQIQAYRYIQQAKVQKGQLSIPEKTVVFTVKQPPSLIGRVRSFAISQGLSISKVVRDALEEFLAGKDHGKEGENC